MSVPAGTLAQKNFVLEKDALAVRARVRGTSMRMLPGVSPLKEADVDVAVDGQMAHVEVSRGVIEPAAGKRLSIIQGSFDIADHRIQPAQSVSASASRAGGCGFRSARRGRVQGSGGWTVPAVRQGRGAVHGERAGQRAAHRDLPAKSRRLHDRCRFHRLCRRQCLRRDAHGASELQGADHPAQLRAPRAGVLGGAQANFDYRKARPDAKPEIRLTATLDDRGRARLGLNIGSRIVGRRRSS